MRSVPRANQAKSRKRRRRHASISAKLSPKNSRTGKSRPLLISRRVLRFRVPQFDRQRCQTAHILFVHAYSIRNRPPLTMQARHLECSQTRHPKWPESATKMRLVRRLSRCQGERDAQVTEHGRRIDVLVVSLKGRQAAKGRSRPRPCENSRSALTSANLDCFLPSVAKSECLDWTSAHCSECDSREQRK